MFYMSTRLFFAGACPWFGPPEVEGGIIRPVERSFPHFPTHRQLNAPTVAQRPAFPAERRAGQA